MKSKGKLVLTKAERTQAIIDYFRGAPDEFGMLKGLLCVVTAAERGAQNKAGDFRARYAEGNYFSDAYDTVALAARMDEILQGMANPKKTAA